ncbi:MAG: TonB-dependent receptor [Gammaproteobacteria bacterium]|nr:TonB-dependent receptor [Gammaproteobacteria bacterium]MDE0270624.1 TonB-dependent receptor [Gammaproteobacteria bacterium]
MNQPFARRRLAACLVVPFLVTGLSAPAAEGGGEIEEILVTGSYIKGTPEDAPLPVTALTRNDLALEGSPTTLDLIKNLSFSQGADGETDQFQAGAGADRATVNIRGLGPSRSLVLINGRRTTWSPHAIGAQAQLLVDVNMMPSIAVERIEILRDGAAATYGSDAIAGVMNFITRSDFTGFEVSANHKTVEDSSGDTEAGVILGTDFADGRGHIVSSFSYIKRGELELSERDWAVRPYADSPGGGWSSVGRPSVVVPLDRWNAFPIGGFVGLLATGIVDPNCEKLGGAITTAGVAGNTGGGFCRFQYTAFDNIAEEAERWQWFTEGSWEISDSITLSGEFLITDSNVPGWNTSPSYPPNRLVDENRTIRANNPGLVDMASKYPDIYGTYAWCDADYCRWQGDPAQTEAGIPEAWQEVAWFYGRYYGQDGPLRDHHRKSDLWRLNFTLEGDLGDYGWTTSATYSKSERDFDGGDTMVYRDARARQGLGGHECEAMVPNEYDENGNLAFSLDTVMAHAGQGPCRYWIPFSNSMPGSHPQVPGGIAENPDFNPALNNQDLLDYMLSPHGGDGETSLLVLEGILTGALPWALSGNELNFAVGAQWRSETYESGPYELNDFSLFPCAAGPEIKDCTTNRNGLFGFLPPGSHIDEDRDIYSVFGELHASLAETVEAQLSVRYEDYGGSAGSSLDPKLALRWQIAPSIGVRASVGTTFRGPTLNQIVASASSNSLQFVGQTGAFKRVDTQGNPDLDPEEATTFNVGLLVDHDGLIGDNDNLFITVDYWSYDFKKPLVTEPFGAVLAAACSGGPTDPCDPASPYFSRLTFGGNAAAANLEIIDIKIINGPDTETDGIDFTARYSMPVGPGIASVGVTGTRILNYDIDSWVLGDAYDALGRYNYGTSLARTLAKWKGRGLVNYAIGPMNLRYNLNYIDGYDDLGGNPSGVTYIKSHMTHDLHLSYSLMDDQVSLSLSAVNLADEDPPFTGREMNYDAFSHNPFGRMFKFGVTYRMGD